MFRKLRCEGGSPVVVHELHDELPLLQMFRDGLDHLFLAAGLDDQIEMIG